MSGGDDSTVKIWNRRDGELLRTLEHHDYVVWNVRLWVDTLMTFSYDCTVATMTIKFQVVIFVVVVVVVTYVVFATVAIAAFVVVVVVVVVVVGLG